MSVDPDPYSESRPGSRRAKITHRKNKIRPELSDPKQDPDPETDPDPESEPILT
jgi:hypothetical protein